MPDEITPSDLLIVDDEREHAQVMCEALQRQGHHCDVTYNLGEARARLDRKRYDVIVTDMVMDGRRDGLELLRTSRQVAASVIPVLMMGESGTGKELIARAIHVNSRRRKQRLVALNCAGLSESILEDELFGHVRGAFTGANTEREGRFEHADRGTLFMDEIGDMPAPMQAKLLRVLENGEVVRLGSNEPTQVDVRLISATNRKLAEMVADKHFREDLYFRIKGVTIEIPPLRERREDIPLLIHFFMNQAAERHHKPVERM